MFRQAIHHVQTFILNRRFRRVFVVVVAVFVLANGAVFLLYKDRTYPNTMVGGHRLGVVERNQLPSRLKALPLLPSEVTFKQAKTAVKAPMRDLGIGIDYSSLSSQAMRARTWLPIANLFQSHDVTLQLTQNETHLKVSLSTTLAPFQRVPADARIARQDASFAIKPESTGQKVDLQTTVNRLLAALGQGQASVAVVTKSVSPTITSLSLQKQLEELQDQTKTSISLVYNGQSRRLSAAEIASLYNESTSTMSLSDAAILGIINSVGGAYGIVVDNQTAALAAIKSALQQHKDLSFTLVAAPKAIKTIRYCTAVRGVSEAELPALNAKLQSTYADSRGWNLAGLIRFERVDGNCEFRVWLSAADQMPSFGAICDTNWSCAVSPNVVINYDRWRFASTAWNAQSGSLDDYRSMVINHETGHWFGFNHLFCSGPGQPAPVMQQQSIDLQGCTFNPWPTVGEHGALKQRLNL